MQEIIMECWWLISRTDRQLCAVEKKIQGLSYYHSRWNFKWNVITELRSFIWRKISWNIIQLLHRVMVLAVLVLPMYSTCYDYRHYIIDCFRPKVSDVHRDNFRNIEESCPTQLMTIFRAILILKICSGTLVIHCYKFYIYSNLL